MNPTTLNDPPGSSYFSREAAASIPWALVNNVALFFLFFATTGLLTRFLDDQEWGLFATCLTIVDVTTMLCALGLNTTLVRFVPELVIHRNRTGMLRLLARAGAIQAAATCVALVVYVAGRAIFEDQLGKPFASVVLIIWAFVAARMLKSFVDDAQTALFHMRTVTFISIGQALMRVALVGALVGYFGTLESALIAQIASILPLAGLGAYLLVRHVRGLDWQSPVNGIGRGRLIRLALPQYVNAILVKFTSEFTEVFFLLYFFSTTTVGSYYLAYRIPHLLITTLPQALQKVYSAAFAQTYVIDPGATGKLVATFYKMMITFILPISIFGVVFAQDILDVVAGPIGAGLGPYMALLFIYHTLAITGLPFGAAIIAAERLHYMAPIHFVQAILNVGLDYLFIKPNGVAAAIAGFFAIGAVAPAASDAGIAGAILALYATYIIVAPFRLAMISRIIGGMYFPARYFFRFFIVLTAFALILRSTASSAGPVLLTVFAIGYGVAYALSLRWFRLLRHEDVAEFRQLGFGKVNRVLDLIVRP